jgi:CheY-like chemotaxis protein
MPQESLPAEVADAQACQARRMQIVGQLTGGVVHDFNNILTVIIGMIEVLAESVAGRPNLAAAAALIDEAAARGAHLTSHLLAFARGQPSPSRIVDVNALLVEAARLLRPTLGEHIEIDAMPVTGAAFVVVDPSRLMTVILDLALMARDAMPEGGRLALAASSGIQGEHCTGADGALVAADHVMIAVNASGHGMSAEHPDRVFADLGSSRDFIRQCSGHIEIRREAGGGTSVEIYLPGAASFARSTAEGASDAPVEGGDEAILIVEDDLMVRQYVVTQVQSLGYRTLAATNAAEALTIIDQGVTIDLLFTDVVMPGAINGRQLATEALHRRPTLKVLYTSGYSQSAMVHDGRLEAGVLLLAKPYHKVDLARMIRVALAA